MLSLFHWTKEKFFTFKIGDIGFRFGTIKNVSDTPADTKEGVKTGFLSTDIDNMLSQENQKVKKNDVTIINPDFRLSGSGKLHFDGSQTKLTALQIASIKALEAYADALGLDIYIETNVNKNINGWFDSKGIHISLEAGTDAKGTLLFTAAHELTHFIKKYSPDKWEMFAEFIVENYMDKDISTGKLIRDQQLKAKRNGINLTTDEAFQEVIADACETMLVDGSALEKLSELRKSDVTLYERIKYFISNLAYNPERRQNYFLLISQYTDNGGNVINIPVYINEKGQYNRIFIDTNKIATVFGRNGIREYINQQLKNGNLVRIKKRSIQTGESTSPINADYGMDTSKDIVSQDNTAVNSNSMQDSEENTSFLSKMLKAN